mgnify:CR=1 FL=1
MSVRRLILILGDQLTHGLGALEDIDPDHDHVLLADHGIPVVISHPDSNPARVFRSVGLTVLQGLEKQA